jgi:hypothetical protein
MDKICLVIQGPTAQREYIEKYYNSFPNVIFSTWEDERFPENGNIKHIYSKIPRHKGNSNVNLQCTSTMTGLTYAQQLGYKIAFKIRSDITISDINKLIELLYTRLQDKRRIYCLAGQKHPRYGLLPVDYCMFGYIEDLIDYWDYEELSQVMHPTEVKLTRKFFQYKRDDIPELFKTKHEISEDDFREYFEFFLSDINKNNIDVIWHNRSDKRFSHPDWWNCIYVNLYTTNPTWFMY